MQVRARPPGGPSGRRVFLSKGERALSAEKNIPKLYLWKNQLLFLGASYIPYREHMVVSDKLIVSTEGEIVINLDDGSQIVTRSCLLKTGTVFDKSTIETRKATVAIYYLDPLTQDYSALESQMPVAIPGIRYGHPQEDELIQRLVHVRDAGLPPNQAYDYLRDLIVHPSLRGVIFKVFDERVVEVVHRIRETVRESLSVSDFALEVNLSASWLEKQFKEQIGIPITKYRLRYRVFVSVIHLAAGMSVTDAALAAGFSSTSHFSKNFSAINGIPPSATFLRPPFLQVMVADNVLEARS